MSGKLEIFNELIEKLSSNLSMALPYFLITLSTSAMSSSDNSKGADLTCITGLNTTSPGLGFSFSISAGVIALGSSSAVLVK